MAIVFEGPESWGQHIGHERNIFARSAGQLVGIAIGLIADQTLNDAEIRFLEDWLNANLAIADRWPGNIIGQRVRAVLDDGIITEIERQYLVDTLRDLIGSVDVEAGVVTEVTELAYDQVDQLVFLDQPFCFSGAFVFGSRDLCQALTEVRGGIVLPSVSKRLRYLVVGSRGHSEWKSGSYGTKIDKAMQLKAKGASILVVREDVWAAAL